MGLLSELLLLPLAPARLAMWTIDRVIDECAAAADWGDPLPDRQAPSPLATLPPAVESVRSGRGSPWRRR